MDSRLKHSGMTKTPNFKALGNDDGSLGAKE